jgi:hypothetical protein
VDGFTDPSQDNRICLGLLSNVNRNVTIENTRRHIGKGVRFICTETLVTVYNCSQSPVFVQSRNSNFKYNLQSTSVCRVPAGSSMIIFDYQLFHNVRRVWLSVMNSCCLDVGESKIRGLSPRLWTAENVLYSPFIRERMGIWLSSTRCNLNAVLARNSTPSATFCKF